MCTLIVVYGADPQLPVVVAANRDEYLDRPAAGPTELRSGGRRVVAPIDLEAGGSWLGVNESGVFAGLTNRPCPAKDGARRSRGLLVMDALEAESAAEAAGRLAALPAETYNPFNLVVADAASAFVTVYEEKSATSQLSAGIHVVGNADPDDRSVPKLDRIFREVEDVVAGPSEGWLPGLEGVCRSHEAGHTPLASTCIHHGGYGTRSSTLLQLHRDSSRSELRFASSAPCISEYQDFSPLLRDLHRTGGNAVGRTERTLR
jgi:uncharacterized protein with NRDE domain